MNFSFLEIAKRLEAIAQAGLSFTDNEYDRERFEEIKDIGHRIFHEYSGAPIHRIQDFFSQEQGYPTPKVDVRGIVFRDQKILMVREKLDGLWALPGGWADIGYSPSEVAVKEVKEEAGIDVIPLKLLAVLDKKCHTHPPSPVYVYKLFILCREAGGDIKPGTETTEVGFFAEHDLPELSTERNTKEQMDMIFQYNRNPDLPTLMD